MKKLIITSLLSLTTVFCFSQNIYKVNTKSLEIGLTVNDSTHTWTDSVLVNPPTILIYTNYVVIENETNNEVFTLLDSVKSNPGIFAFNSVEEKTKKPCVVTYFTSSCLDKTTITFIIEYDMKSYNYIGSIE